MSGDEVFATIISAIVAIWGWAPWIGGLLFLNRLSRRTPTQILGWVVPPIAGLVMLFALKIWASHDVRDSAAYLNMYMLMWLAWLGAWNRLLPFLGLSCRDDALERDNTAAGLAISGGLFGVTFIFAGANIGDGPGWWVVVFCAAIATALLAVLWIAGNQFTRIDEVISIDRDIAAGLRTAGFFIAAGLILGRAVAGDWHSTAETVTDFIQRGWPVLILWVVAMVTDWLGRPVPTRPAVNWMLLGVIPCLLFIAMGAGDIAIQGRW